MSYEAVVKEFAEKGIANEILLFEDSCATVELAAQRLNCAPGEIAKTLAVRRHDKESGQDEFAVLVMCGTARIDNRKYKDTFHCKAQMLSFDETLEVTGHPVGGVCPFGLPKGVAVYLDESLKRYEAVFPAAGTGNSAVRFLISELEEATGGIWVNVTKVLESEEGNGEGGKDADRE